MIMTNITFTCILSFSNIYTLRNVNSIVIQHNLYTIMIIISKNSDKKSKQWIYLKILYGVWDNCEQLKALDQKMLFISSLKLFLFLRHLHFRLDLLVKQENGLIKNRKLISEFMTSQIGQQIKIIYISPDISICKGNQTMEFSQLIKYNLRNIFLSKMKLITKQRD